MSTSNNLQGAHYLSIFKYKINKYFLCNLKCFYISPGMSNFIQITMNSSQTKAPVGNIEQQLSIIFQLS